MKKFFISLGAILLTYVYLVFLNDGAPLILLPCVYLFYIYSIYGFRAVIVPMVIVGVYLDLHVSQFGIYTASLFISLGSVYLLQRNLLTQNSLLSRFFAYFLGFTVLLFVLLLLENLSLPPTALTFHKSLLLAILGIAALKGMLVAVIRAMYDYFNPTLLTNE